MTQIGSNEDKTLVQSITDPSHLLQELQSDEDKHSNNSRLRRSLITLEPAIRGFKAFGAALDVICNAKPEVLCLVWGGLRLVLRLANSVTDFFDGILACIKEIGTNLTRIRTLEQTFSSSVELRKILLELYQEVLDFFLRTKRLYVDTEEEKRHRLVPKRLSIALQAVFSSFKSQFQTNQTVIHELLERLNKQAITEGLVAAKSSQDSIANEITKANQHRTLETAEMQQQQRERKLQTDWRKVQQTHWDEARKSSEIWKQHLQTDSSRKLYQWLSPVEQQDKHSAILKMLYRGTGQWILSDSIFDEWMQSRCDILWVNAIPGAGKTVMTSNVIEHLRANTKSDEGLAFFYFDYMDFERQSVQSYLSSVVVDLAQQNHEYFEAISPRLSNAQTTGRAPPTTMLEECLVRSANHFSVVNIVLDALDECADTEALMVHLQTLSDEGNVNFRIFLTSRLNADISDAFQDIKHLELTMDTKVIQQDIETYVRGEVQEAVHKKRIKLRDAKLQDQIIQSLSVKADGMFQWVKCQMDQIRRLKTDKAIRQCLESLPRGLNETYLQLLQRMTQSRQEDEIVQTSRMMRWLVHSTRLLTVEELSQAIAIERDQVQYDASAALTDPTDLLNLGYGLVVFSSDKRRSLRLSHFSVREFLTSDFCLENMPSFYMGTDRSCAELASTCLTVLMFSDFDEQNHDDEDEDCKELYTYASTQWAEHYRRTIDSEHCPLQQALTFLSLPDVTENFSHLRTWLGLPSNYLPTHYCAQHGLFDILRKLLDGGAEVDSDCDMFGTPLNMAARYDQGTTADFLIDRGANLNYRKAYKATHSGNSCLHWALDEGQAFIVSVRTIEVLAQAPSIEIDALGGMKLSQTGLHYAARSDRIDIIDMLLSHGASIDAVDSTGQTPLNAAVEEQSLEAVAYLLDQGASMVRVDKCNSMREAGFGFLDDSSNVSEAHWEALAELRSRQANNKTKHWGFALGNAAQSGSLDPLKELLDQHVSQHSLSSSSAQDLGKDASSSFTVKQLEARIGTMFGAVAPALHAGHDHVVSVLLSRIIDALASVQQRNPEPSELDLHLLLICDCCDSPFCDCEWSESPLFVAIVLGYLRLALRTLSMMDAGVFPLRLPKALTIKPLSQESQLAIYAGWDRNATIGGSDDAEFEPNIVRRDSILSMQSPAVHAKVVNLYEKAREIWQAKRNPREGFRLFVKTMTDCDEETAKHRCLEYLVKLGLNVNSLDRAGRTPVFWSIVRSWPDTVNVLESLGGTCFTETETSFSRIRTSVLDIIAELLPNQEAFESLRTDLSRKADWDNLGRYLYFGGDDENARRSFEAGAVFDPDIEGPIPAFHYFICDICHTEYRDDLLIKGPRYVPLCLVNIDLCEACSEGFGAMRLRIPSDDWVFDQRLAYEAQQKAYADFSQTETDAASADAARFSYRQNRAIEQRRDIVKWLSSTQERWSNEASECRDRYNQKEEALKLWLTDAPPVLQTVKGLTRW